MPAPILDPQTKQRRQPASDTRELFFNKPQGHYLATDGAAPASSNPNGVPGVMRSAQPGGNYLIGAAPGKSGLTMVQTTPPPPGPSQSSPVGTAANPSPNPVAQMPKSNLTRVNPYQPIDSVRESQPGTFGRENATANAGIYQPGTFGATNAKVNGTGYVPPAQTEARNPLTGDTNQTPGGSSQPISQPSIASELGFSSRGTTTPRGQDASPTGGTGMLARKFSNPRSAGLYDQFVRSLFEEPVGG